MHLQPRLYEVRLLPGGGRGRRGGGSSCDFWEFLFQLFPLALFLFLFFPLSLSA